MLKIGALVAILVLVVVACGSSGSGSNNTENKRKSNELFSGYGLDIEPAPPASDPHNPDAGAGTPKRGGKVTLALQAEDPNGYCLPAAQLDASGEQIAGSIYDTLVRPTADGKFVPYLAKTVTPSADFKTWTITLRPGIKFNDGSALTAQVVADNLNAYRGKNPNITALLFQFVFKDISNVKVTGPLTVEVDMTTPWRDFDTFLYGSRRVGIIGEAQLNDPKNCAKHLVGTGPFMLKSWTVNQKYTMVPNPNYWRKAPDGGKLPYLSELDYVPISDSGAQISAFQSHQGGVNAILTTSADNILKLRSMAQQKKARLITSVRYTELGYFMFNVTTAPFNDQNMRLAASQAIDSAQINKQIGHDITPLAAQPFAPGNIGYSTKITRIPYDPAAAKKLVAAYKQEHGAAPKVTVSATTDPVTEQTAQVVQSYLKAAGFDATTAFVDQAELINDAIGGNFQLATFRNFNGADPMSQYVWWHSGEPTNFNKFSDPILDCLLEVGRQGSAAASCLKDPKLNADYNQGLPAGLKPLSQLDPDDIHSLAEAMSEEFKKKAWNLWGSYSGWTVATSPDVHGVFGLPNPDGTKPTEALANGTAVEGLWVG